MSLFEIMRFVLLSTMAAILFLTIFAPCDSIDEQSEEKLPEVKNLPLFFFGSQLMGEEDDQADIEEQINQAAKEMREAQERFHALVAEHLSYQSTDAEIAAKTFPQYFKGEQP